jgi:hypothetical protein
MANEMENKDLQDQVSTQRADDDASKNERLEQQGRMKRILDIGSFPEDEDDYTARLASYYEGAADRIETRCSTLRQIAEQAKKNIADRTIVDQSQPAVTKDKETK